MSAGIADGTSVPDDQDVVPEHFGRVRNQHHVLVPAHQLALAGRAADDEPVHAVLDLVLHYPIEGVQVELAVLPVGRLDGCDHSCLLQQFQLPCAHKRLLLCFNPRAPVRERYFASEQVLQAKIVSISGSLLCGQFSSISRADH